MLTGEQVRAARALLSWSEEKLAEEAHLTAAAVRQFEDLGTTSHISTSDMLRRALEAAGAEFIAGNGSVCVHYRNLAENEGIEPQAPDDEGIPIRDLNAANDG